MEKIDFANVIHINHLRNLLENKLNFDIYTNKYISIYLVVDNIKESLTKNGKPYIAFTGRENEDMISCKVWNCNKGNFLFRKNNEKIRNGDLVKIVGVIEEHEGSYQITVYKDEKGVCIRKVNEKDNVDFDYFFKKAPISYEEMINYINTLVLSFKDDDFKNICLLFLEEYSKELQYYPAGKANHHAYKLGLLYHIYNMLKQGEHIADIYKLNRELLLTGILLHDSGKIITLNSNDYGIVSEFNIESILLEHLVQGVLIVEELGKKSNISKDKILLLQHMIASHHGRPEWGSPVYSSFPEAEALHHIDNLDAKLNAMKENLSSLNEDEFLTNRIHCLDNRILYKHNLY